MMSNGSKSCAFIWTIVVMTTAIHRLRVTRQVHQNVRRRQRSKIRQLLGISALQNARRLMRTKAHHPKSPLPLRLSTRTEESNCPKRITCVRREHHTSSLQRWRLLRRQHLGRQLGKTAIIDERSDTKLGRQDKSVFQYREERQLQYWSKGQSMNLDAFNEQYDTEQFNDTEQFKLVQELLES
jgi:hypothetical protein